MILIWWQTGLWFTNYGTAYTSRHFRPMYHFFDHSNPSRLLTIHDRCSHARWTKRGPIDQLLFPPPVYYTAVQLYARAPIIIILSGYPDIRIPGYPGTYYPGGMNVCGYPGIRIPTGTRIPIPVPGYPGTRVLL